MAYKGSSSDPHKGVSVDLERLIVEAGKDPKQLEPRWVATIRFEAAKLRSCGCKVGYDPLTPPPIDNPFHGEIWYHQTDTNIRQVSRLAQHYDGLEGVSLVVP